MSHQTLDAGQLLRVTGGDWPKWDITGHDRFGVGSPRHQAWNDCTSGNVPAEVISAMKGGSDILTNKVVGPIGHPETYACNERLKNFRLGRGAIPDYQVDGWKGW